jgi:ribokinase
MFKSVIVVGSINIDLVARSSRIPSAGETVSGTDFQIFPGGKGANQAVAAARLGEQTHIVGKVGTDIFGEQLRNELIKAGVGISGLTAEEGPSGVGIIATDEQGQNAIIVVPGANGKLTPEDLDRNIGLFKSAGVLLTQLEIPLDTVEYLSTIAQKENIPLILDPAPANHLPASILRRVDWLTPNETEICTLLGISASELVQDNLNNIAGAFQAMGVKNVALKLGKLGCFLQLEDGTTEFIPAFAVNTIDTTAAGDAFNGALASSMIRGSHPTIGGRWASAAAAISVTRHGAQPSMPTRPEVEEFITSFNPSVSAGPE